MSMSELTACALQSFLTFGDSHSAHSHPTHATQNGDDRSRGNSEEEHGGGWGFQRLWRRGEQSAPSAPHSEGSEPAADGFGSVIGGRGQSPTGRPRNVFLPSAPSELRIKITKCAPAAASSAITPPADRSHMWPRYMSGVRARA